MLFSTFLFFVCCYGLCYAQDDSIPSIISQQDVIHSVVEGSTVVLPCKFDKTIGVYSIVWRKSFPDDDNVLFAERSRITDDERLSYASPDDLADWSLKIEQVRTSDAGTYECTLSSDPMKTLTQKLEIKSPPNVNILPEKSPQILAAGSPLTLTCQAGGNPTPTITWSKSDGALPPTDTSSKPGQLVFKSVSDLHSGIYECTADNTVGQPAHAKVEVQVSSISGRAHAPKVSVDRSFIPIATSQTFNLTCFYDSRPMPMIEWFMGGYKIDFDNPKNRQRMKLIDRKEKENSGASTIVVSDVKKDDFGNYTCRAINNVGTGEATAVVSGYPDRPNINVEIDPSGESAIVHLQAKSIEPVVDFQLDIMKTGPDAEKNPRSTIIPPSHAGPALDDSTYSGKYRLEKLDPGASYYLTAKARNGNGYGSLSAKSFRPEKVEAAKQTENSQSSTVARDFPPKGSGSIRSRLSTFLIVNCFSLVVVVIFASSNLLRLFDQLL